MAKTKSSTTIKNTKLGYTFSAKTTKEALQMVWDTVKSEGHIYQGQRGKVKSIKGGMIVIRNPLAEEYNYPYWGQDDDNWYQDNFVRKETTGLPENLGDGKSDIFPYKYSWRSRHYDSGWGYVSGVVSLLKRFDYNKISFKDKNELIDFLKKSYKIYHPENILSVLAWKGKDLLNFYLSHPDILSLELLNNRRDTLETVIEEVKLNPSTRRAIMPSFTYEQIDHSKVAGGVPVYQNYQLYTEFDEHNNPSGLISMHIHRAFDVKGGTQLDISHDREWGQIASQKLGLPLKAIIIYGNDLWYEVSDDPLENESTPKNNIHDWLFWVTDAYNPQKEDIKKRLASRSYTQKIDYTWEILSK